jgi:VCBS repeat-containing protein
MADDFQTFDAGPALPAAPVLRDDIFEGVLNAVAAGQAPTAELEVLRETVREAVLDAGGTSGSAQEAADVFIATFNDELFQGGQTVADAGSYAREAMARAIETYDPASADQSPADALLSAIASGQGVEAAVSGMVATMTDGADKADPEALEAVYLEALQEALAQGASPEAVIAEADGAAAEAARSQAAAEVPVENPILSALSGGENVGAALDAAADASGGDAEAFRDGLEASLADGVAADTALDEAQQAAADTAAAKAAAEVELSAGDQLAAALASGEDVGQKLEEAGGGEAFAAALEESLAGGSGAGDALQAAGEAEARQAEMQAEQSVPLSAADQLAASLASGENVDGAIAEAGGDGAFAAALEESLAAGGAPDAAMANGQQAADAAATAQAEQSVPVSAADQLAASLASGENVDQALENAGGGEAFAEELEASLAAGEAPAQSMAEAQAAEQAAGETQAAQEVPADPAVQALAQGGEAAQGADVAEAVASATGETGGEASEQAQAAAEPAPAGQPDTQTAGTSETGGEPDSEQTQQSAQTDPASEPEPQQTTTAQTNPAGEPAAQQSAQSEPAGEPEPEPQQIAQADAEGEQAADAEAEAEGEGETQTRTAESTEAVAEGAGDGEAATGETEGAADGGVTETIQTAGTEEGDGEGEGQGGTQIETQIGAQTAGTDTGGTDADDLVDAAALDDIATAAGGGSGTGGGSGVSFESARNASNIGGSDSGLGGGGSNGFQSSVTVGSGSGGGGTGGGSRTSSRNDDDVLTGGAGDDDLIVNNAPIAAADSGTTSENVPVTIGVLANDRDPDGDAITLVSASVPAGKGTVTVAGGSVQFVPGNDFNHLDVGDTETVTIAYTIRDSAGNSANGSVALTVTATNDNPVIEVAGTALTGGVTEATDNADGGSPALTTSGTIAFTDLDAHGSHTVDVAAAGRAAGTLTAAVTTPAAGGTGQVAWDYSVAETAYDFLAAGASVTEAFTVTITDDQGESVQQTVRVTITGTNDSPQVAGPVDGGTLAEDAGVLTVDLLTGAGDVDTADLDVANLTVTAADGRPLFYSLNAETGVLTFEPGWFEDLAAGETLAISATYNVIDGLGGVTGQTATITIQGANDAPAAIYLNPDPASGAEEASIPVPGVIVDDADFGASLTVTLTAADGGTVSADANGGGAAIAAAGTGIMTISGSPADVNAALQTLSYTGAENFAGNSSIAVTVSDGLASTSETVSVTVTPVNDAPTLSVSAARDTVATFNGANSYIDVPDTALNNQTAGTIETWVYFDGTDTGAIFAKQNNNVDSVAVLRVENGQILYQSTNKSTTDHGMLTGATALQPDTWHHVAVSFSQSGAAMYLDGQEIASLSGDFSIPHYINIPNESGGPAIGAWLGHGGGRHLNGEVAEFRIWDTARSQAEIQAAMNTSLTGGEAGLRALYNFSDAFADGGTVKDATGSYDAVSSNAASGTGGLTGAEDTAIAIDGISVTDVDGDVLTVTVEAPAGSVLAATAGTGGADVNAAGNAQAVIRGTAEDVNAALETLTFTPPQNFNGTAQLSVAV